jgi:predicted AAA+ superfamily ATPase
MNYIFLDEIQNIPDFERLVDGLFATKNTFWNRLNNLYGSSTARNNSFLRW